MPLRTVFIATVSVLADERLKETGWKQHRCWPFSGHLPLTCREEPFVLFVCEVYGWMKLLPSYKQWQCYHTFPSSALLEVLILGRQALPSSAVFIFVFSFPSHCFLFLLLLEKGRCKCVWMYLCGSIYMRVSDLCEKIEWSSYAYRKLML